MKTKSAVKKRFKLMGSGIIKMGQCGKRHCMRKRASRTIQQHRGMTTITSCEVRRMSRGLVVGARRVKPKSNATMVRDYMSNISSSTLRELMADDLSEGVGADSVTNMEAVK